jgi:hypothetical protein
MMTPKKMNAQITIPTIAPAGKLELEVFALLPAVSVDDCVMTLIDVAMVADVPDEI